MHKNNNNKSYNFIQGLKPFSNTIPKTLKKYLRKGGYNYSNIVDNWTKMVNKKVSSCCYPVSIKMGKDMKNGNLILGVIHGKEMEIEYEKNNIIDQINSFFGYDCIKQITLKVMQEKINDKKNNLPQVKNLSKINQKIEKINNDNLKSSLNNFLRAFNEKHK